jgi:hypothetical protein
MNSKLIQSRVWSYHLTPRKQDFKIATSSKERPTVVSIESICDTPQLPLVGETFVISGNVAHRGDNNKFITAWQSRKNQQHNKYADEAFKNRHWGWYQMKTQQRRNYSNSLTIHEPSG